MDRPRPRMAPKRVRRTRRRVVRRSLRECRARRRPVVQWVGGDGGSYGCSSSSALKMRWPSTCTSGSTCTVGGGAELSASRGASASAAEAGARGGAGGVGTENHWKTRYPPRDKGGCPSIPIGFQTTSRTPKLGTHAVAKVVPNHFQPFQEYFESGHGARPRRVSDHFRDPC